MRLLIITPAIPRPDLHKICISSFYKNLLMTKSFDDIIHIINIDAPEKIIKDNKNIIDETIKNFKEIIPNFVNVQIINENNSNFSTAYKRIFLEGEKYITDNCCIIYLEDDWEFLMNDDIGILIDRFGSFKNVILSLSALMISNNPVVYGVRAYKKMVDYLKKKNVDNIDPDYLLRPLKIPSLHKNIQKESIKLYYIKKGNKSDYKYGMKRIIKSGKYNYYKIVEKCFVDSIDEIEINNNFDVVFISNLKLNFNCIDKGREWLESRNIKKWDKDEKNIKTY